MMITGVPTRSMLPPSQTNAVFDEAIIREQLAQSSSLLTQASEAVRRAAQLFPTCSANHELQTQLAKAGIDNLLTAQRTLVEIGELIEEFSTLPGISEVEVSQLRKEYLANGERETALLEAKSELHAALDIKEEKDLGAFTKGELEVGGEKAVQARL